MNSSTLDFKTKTGTALPGFTSAQLRTMHEELKSKLHMNDSALTEAASYSMAMVVRYALGLSAAGGKVCALAKDSLAGWVALAAIRHLVNAGCTAHVLFLPEDAGTSQEAARQLKALEALGVTLTDGGSSQEMDAFTAFLGEAHNILFGVYTPGQESEEILLGICEVLNEDRIPVHCIECPPGLNPDTGIAVPSALYASSTLSLGAPLVGLNKGKDYVGRHYLCDISFSPALYKSQGADLSPLFSDQPVIQILPSASDGA